MNFDDFMTTIGLLIKEVRIGKKSTLYELAFKTGIVADHIQKIESFKHGGIQLLTYAKILHGLECGLSFKTKNMQGESLKLSSEFENILDCIFFGLTKDKEYQYLTYKPSVLLNEIAQQVRMKRNKLNLSQNKLAEISGMSNTTIYRIESGTHNISLHSLYKLCNSLKKFK